MPYGSPQSCEYVALTGIWLMAALICGINVQMVSVAVSDRRGNIQGGIVIKFVQNY